MEKHSLETWLALTEVDPIGTFNKLIQFFNIDFSTAQSILSDNNNDYRSASQHLLKQFRSSFTEDPPSESHPSTPSRISQQKITKGYLEKSLGDFTYVIIGFLFANLVPILVFLLVYIIPFEDVSSTYIIISLLIFIAIILLSTIGRYGKISFYGVINIFIWSFIPIANWWVAYYLGKGIHIQFSKQTLQNPHKPTATGLIIIIVILGLAWIGGPSFPNFNLALAPTPTLRPRPSPTVYRTPISAQNPTCTHWSKITKQFEGRPTCVYGIVINHTENWENGLTNFYFGNKDQFFLVSNFRWTDSQEGNCLTATGVIQLNTFKVPYIKVEDNIYYCEPWMTNP